MQPGNEFNTRLVSDIKAQIRQRLSARHVPKYVFQCWEIPVRFVPKGHPILHAMLTYY